MTRLRSLLLGHRWLALAIVAVALVVRTIVPAGMMPGHGAAGATLIVCPGHSTMPGMAMPGMAMPSADRGAAKPGAGPHDPAKADPPCAFTDLLAAAVGGATLPVLPAMPLPVAAVAVAGLAIVTRQILRLRPPLRGPPARAAA